MANNLPEELCSNYKVMPDYPHNGVEIGSIWQLVKTLEENRKQDKNQLGEIVATLLVNFGPNNNGRFPVLVSPSDKPFAMLIKVLEHLCKSE